MSQQLTLDEPALLFAQKLVANPKPAYSIKKDAIPAAGSMPTAYRRLNSLKSLGLARSSRGHFVLNAGVVMQPAYIVYKLLPSLESLKNARRFGRYYNDSDVKFALDNVAHTLVTLDYKAWELTEFQYPSDLYMYVEDIDQAAASLRKSGFSEGIKGRVVILPMIGEFANKIERVYLDCIANGGRSLQDAVAIELLYGNQLRSKGTFPIELVRKVQGDLRGADEKTGA